MKKNIFIITIILGVIAAISSCERELPPLFHGTNGVCFSAGDLANTDGYKKIYEWAGALNPDADIDTCWLDIMSVGEAVPYDRPIKLKQVESLVKDVEEVVPGIVIDTVYRKIPNQAVVDVNYIAFDKVDPKLMVLPANAYKARIPIVLIKDKVDYRTFTLKVQMVPTEETKIGDARLSTCLIEIR